MQRHFFKSTILLYTSAIAISGLEYNPAFASNHSNAIEIDGNENKLTKSGFRRRTEDKMNSLGYDINSNPVEVTIRTQDSSQYPGFSDRYKLTFGTFKEAIDLYNTYARRESGIHEWMNKVKDIIELKDKQDRIAELLFSPIDFPKEDHPLYRDTETKQEVTLSSLRKVLLDPLVKYLDAKHKQLIKPIDNEENLDKKKLKEIKETMEVNLKEQTQIGYFLLMVQNAAYRQIAEEVNKIVAEATNIKTALKTTYKTLIDKEKSAVENTQDEQVLFQTAKDEFNDKNRTDFNNFHKKIEDLDAYLKKLKENICSPGTVESSFLPAHGLYYLLPWTGHPRVDYSKTLYSIFTAEDVDYGFNMLVSRISSMEMERTKESYERYKSLFNIVFGVNAQNPYPELKDWLPSTTIGETLVLSIDSLPSNNSTIPKVDQDVKEVITTKDNENQEIIVIEDTIDHNVDQDALENTNTQLNQSENNSPSVIAVTIDLKDTEVKKTTEGTSVKNEENSSKSSPTEVNNSNDTIKTDTGSSAKDPLTLPQMKRVPLNKALREHTQQDIQTWDANKCKTTSEIVKENIKKLEEFKKKGGTLDKKHENTLKSYNHFLDLLQKKL